jgi:hypothetical protein
MSAATRMMKLLIVGVLLSSMMIGIIGDNAAAELKKRQNKHQYQRYDEIPMIAEKLWAKGNPSETYDYYYLPFCGNDEASKEVVGQDMGADVSGSRRRKTKYDIRFQVNIDHFNLCDPKPVSKNDLNRLRNAVQNRFMLLLYYDGLPLKFMIGKTYPATEASRARIVLFTHLNFYLSYNQDRVSSIATVYEYCCVLIV